MTRRLLAAAAAALALTTLGAAASWSVAATAPEPGTIISRVTPLHDRRGLHPGLTPVPAGGLPAARAAIARVRTAPAGSLAGYDRVKDFGTAWTDANTATWGHDGCATREEVLHRDLTAVTLRAGTHGCVVLEGQLAEPYTGRAVSFSKSRPLAVQIDHVMPLAYDWAHGARGWTRARRVQLANDPLNLLAVDGPTNESKGDQGPATWLPPNPKVRCAYAVRFALVAMKYGLTVTPGDAAAMTHACR